MRVGSSISCSRVVLLGLAAALLLACAAAPRAPAELREAKPEEVGDCSPLGTVEEAVESPAEDEALEERVKDAARARAAELGATHIVFVSLDVEPTFAEVRAELFRCR